MARDAVIGHYIATARHADQELMQCAMGMLAPDVLTASILPCPIRVPPWDICVDDLR